MQALVLSKPGDFNSIKVEEVPDPKPKKDEIIVKNNFAGINFFDYAFAKGIYKLQKLPAILGIEGSGIVSEVGSDVKDFRVGDRVTYFNAGTGSFAQKKAVLASTAI
ncbi:MAG: alcohol dehydrogenase catalytic domain-containing protein, partial [Alphaproteobacteria bacterium]